MKKKIVYMLSAFLAVSLAGCGSSHHSSTSESSLSNVENNLKEIKVLDGYIIGANVCDANNICATTDNNGIAKAAFAKGVLIAKGGYIDVNNNHKIDNDDIPLPDTFSLKGGENTDLIDPVTDMIQNGLNPVKLASIVGVNKDELYNDPIETNDVTLAKIIQILYVVKVENKESAFINKINNFSNEKTSTENTTPSSSSNNIIPVSLMKTYILPIGNTDNNSVTANNNANSSNTTTANNNSNTATTNNGINVNNGLEKLAAIAESLVDDKGKQLISIIIKNDATSAVELEKNIASEKTQLLNPSQSINTTQSQAAENTQSQAVENTQSQAVENTQSQAVENTQSQTENNTQSKTEEGTVLPL